MRLPNELVINIVKHIKDEETQSALAASFRFFRRVVNQPRIVAKLASCAAWGDEDKVKQLLNISPGHLGYLAARTTIKDPSGRVFPNISAFQYAIWAMDWHMWMMMLDSLQEVANAKSRYKAAEAIRVELLAQYDEASRGLNYTLNGVDILGEQHFDFQPLMEVLETYVEQFDNWDRGQQEQYWCQVIGGAQLNVPSHVAQEYCRGDRSFYPEPSFKEASLPRAFNYYHGVTSSSKPWWPRGVAVNKLGVDLAIFRSSDPAHCVLWVGIGSKYGFQVGARVDLAAVAALCKVRNRSGLNNLWWRCERILLRMAILSSSN